MNHISFIVFFLQIPSNSCFKVTFFFFLVFAPILHIFFFFLIFEIHQTGAAKSLLAGSTCCVASARAPTSVIRFKFKLHTSVFSHPDIIDAPLNLYLTVGDSHTRTHAHAHTAASLNMHAQSSSQNWPSTSNNWALESETEKKERAAPDERQTDHEPKRQKERHIQNATRVKSSPGHDVTAGDGAGGEEAGAPDKCRRQQTVGRLMRRCDGPVYNKAKHGHYRRCPRVEAPARSSTMDALADVLKLRVT